MNAASFGLVLAALLGACSAPCALASSRTCQVGDKKTWMSSEHADCSFQHIKDVFPVRAVSRGSGPVREFRQGDISNKFRYTFAGQQRSVGDFMGRTRAKAVVFVSNDTLLIERYAGGADADTSFLLFSITKSLVSTLVGIAVDQHLIGGVDDRVDTYRQDLVNSGYRGVRVRDLMMMASGTSFDENYDDPKSSIAAFFDIANRNQGGLYEFARSFGSVRPAGTVFRYSSADTEVLGAVLESATHQHLADFASRVLWPRIGAEADAYWVLDAPNGQEVSAGGFSARARDLARFGLVFAAGGKGQGGDKVVSQAWIKEATTPQSEFVEFGHLPAGRGIVPGVDLGYGYQWWLRRSPDLMIAAMGMYGQFILIDPKRGSVLVVTSAWERPYVREHYEEVIALFDSLQATIDTACRVLPRKQATGSHTSRPEWCAA